MEMTQGLDTMRAIPLKAEVRVVVVFNQLQGFNYTATARPLVLSAILEFRNVLTYNL